MNLFSSICGKISNKGFTLVEALIATILVGSCIMPIVGTMKNAETMTQRMVNDNKLQMLARSRMNLETSRANNEQLNIDTTTGWLYEVYESEDSKFPNSVQTRVPPSEYFKTGSGNNINLMSRVYRIQVKINENVKLQKQNSEGEMEDGESNLRGLKQIVITSQIVGEDGQFYKLEANNDEDKTLYSSEFGSISQIPPPTVYNSIPSFRL